MRYGLGHCQGIAIVAQRLGRPLQRSKAESPTNREWESRQDVVTMPRDCNPRRREFMGGVKPCPNPGMILENIGLAAPPKLVPVRLDFREPLSTRDDLNPGCHDIPYQSVVGSIGPPARKIDRRRRRTRSPIFFSGTMCSRARDWYSSASLSGRPNAKSSSGFGATSVPNILSQMVNVSPKFLCQCSLATLWCNWW